jgi:hypothetical protein
MERLYRSLLQRLRFWLPAHFFPDQRALSMPQKSPWRVLRY